jgi:hypothetical protein
MLAWENENKKIFITNDLTKKEREDGYEKRQMQKKKKAIK